MSLEKKDIEILLELDYDCRKSLSQVARKLKISKDSVINRLKKLEEKKIISKYYSVIDYYILGYKTYKLYVKLNRSDSKLEKEIVSFFKKSNLARFISFITNDYDFVVTFNVEDDKEFYDLYSNFSKNFSKYILDKSFAIITKQSHFKQPFVENKKNSMFVTSIQKEPKITLSKTEKDLLRLLSLDARANFVELSRKLDKKPNSLLYCLRSLEKRKIIIGHRPRINYSKLNLTHYSVSLNFSQPDHKFYDSLKKFIGTLSGIIYISEGIADFDLEFELVCENSVELMQTLKEVKNTFGENINKINTRTVISTNTLNYIPF